MADQKREKCRIIDGISNMGIFKFNDIIPEVENYLIYNSENNMGSNKFKRVRKNFVKRFF